MAAYTSDIAYADTGGLSANATASISSEPTRQNPGPAILPFDSLSGKTFQSDATLQLILVGRSTGYGNDFGDLSKIDGIQLPPVVGSFRLFAGTNQYGQGGTFVCVIDAASHALNGAAFFLGSGIEGYGQFSTGKLGSQGMRITIPVAALPASPAGGILYMTLTPEDGNHVAAIAKLTGTTN